MPFDNKRDARTYTLTFCGRSGTNLADGAVFYAGGPGGALVVNGLDGYYEVPIPITGRAVAYGYHLNALATNTGTSAETGTVLLRTNTNGSGTADVATLDSAIVFTAASGAGFSAQGTCNLAVTAGTVALIKVVCPTWATNPTANFEITLHLIIEY